MDLDFLVHRDDLNKLHAVLTGLGYRRVVQTENVSHFEHSEAEWGGLDFVHAFRKASLGMLERAKTVPLFGGTETLRVAQPEDVIGLKVQGMVNNPEHRSRELADIERLMGLHGSKLDWGRIQEFYAIFGLAEEGRQLQRRFEHAQ